MRFATSNLENLFERARALNQEDPESGNPVLADDRELHLLIQEAEYTEEIKDRFLEIMRRHRGLASVEMLRWMALALVGLFMAGCSQSAQPRPTATVSIQATATAAFQASYAISGIRFRTPSDWSFDLTTGHFSGIQGLTVKTASHPGQKLSQSRAWDLARQLMASEGLKDIQPGHTQQLSHQGLDIWSLEGQAWRVVLVGGDKEILSFRCGADASLMEANQKGWQQLLDSLSPEAPASSPTASPSPTVTPTMRPETTASASSMPSYFRNLEYQIPEEWKEVDGGKWLTPEGIWVVLWMTGERRPLKSEQLRELLESSGNFRDIRWDGPVKSESRGDIVLWRLQGKALWNKQRVGWFACLPEPKVNPNGDKHTFFLACAPPERGAQARAALERLAATLRLQSP